MTTEPLLTIGSFARAVGLTASALRHYDDCGLLPPAATDPASGYRYYTPDLVRRARLVAGMRDAGVAIDTMRTVLDATPDVAQKALRELLDSRAERAARDEAALVAVLEAVQGSEPGPPAQTQVDGPVLAAALRQVRPAADGDPASPLSSVLLEVTPDGVDVVATNRFWMALRTLPFTGSGSGRAVLSLPVAARLADALDAAGEVAVEVTGDRVVLLGEEYAARHVAYPSHRVVLDGLDDATTTAVLPTATLAGAVQAAGRAEVTLELAVGGPVLDGREIGGTVAGADLTLRLGAALLLRGIAACLGPEVVVAASAPARPLRLRSPYQAGFVALVMPIRPE
ncbi:MerR family transcriptional regulator [Nocardioides sp. CER19]|uniref:MerR family transcriptional regulator n=1 Tax=Nocardioides sp. CER19 TaxID=3038538 RepID=UPI0024469F11|nr:MerR family transcriptional regulator [Nocardioides sp. CER19]MDH2416365.1 MerR family transcriptional regulator [Nocardioides sp. CER19]